MSSAASRQKSAEITPGLPAGVTVVPIYDRSALILRAIDNLKSTLIEVILTVALVIFLFLWHIPSAVIPVITIPIAVLLAFIPFRLMGLTANIMSIGGIAIAIGAMVDAAIVVVEQTHKKLEEWEQNGRREDYRTVVVSAIKQVAGPSFFAMLVIAVSFLPVLTLEAQEGRLFKPLAYTKTLSMFIAALLAITLDPALRMFFTRVRNFDFRPRWLCRTTNAVLVGTIHSEDKHPISRVLIRLYQPVAEWSLRWKWAVIASALVLVIVTIPVFQKLGSEFMPPLDEGAILYMPSTLPGISIAEAQKLLQATDRIIKAVSGSGPGSGKSRPRRNIHGPGPAVHAGNRDHVASQGEMAAGGHLVFSLGPGMGQGRIAPVCLRSHLIGAADPRDERRPEASRTCQRLDHADQGPYRHAHHRHSHPDRPEDLGR